MEDLENVLLESVELRYSVHQSRSTLPFRYLTSALPGAILQVRLSVLVAHFTTPDVLCTQNRIFQDALGCAQVLGYRGGGRHDGEQSGWLVDSNPAVPGPQRRLSRTPQPSLQSSNPSSHCSERPRPMRGKKERRERCVNSVECAPSDVQRHLSGTRLGAPLETGCLYVFTPSIPAPASSSVSPLVAPSCPVSYPNPHAGSKAWPPPTRKQTTHTTIPRSYPSSTVSPSRALIRRLSLTSTTPDGAFSAKHVPYLGYTIKESKVFHWKVQGWGNHDEKLTSPEFSCGGHKWYVLPGHHLLLHLCDLEILSGGYFSSHSVFRANLKMRPSPSISTTPAPTRVRVGTLAPNSRWSSQTFATPPSIPSAVRGSQLKTFPSFEGLPSQRHATGSPPKSVTGVSPVSAACRN